MNAKSYETAKYMIDEYFTNQKKKDEELLAKYIKEGNKAGISCIEECLAEPWHGKPRKGSLLAWRKREEDKLEKANNAGELVGLEIVVEWHKSRTWGMNPTADCFIIYRNEKGYIESYITKGSASGCGYDKQSAAVNDAISETPELMRFVLENEKIWNYYAVEKLPFPRFSFGGKGISTIESVFRDLDGWKTDESHGKAFDAYKFKKET